MNNFERALSERVEEKYREWKERYEIPELYEFQVRTLIELQEEYKAVSKTERGHTKTRENLLQMIEGLQSRLPSYVLVEKKKEAENKTKIYIACRNNNQVEIIFHLMQDLFSKDKIIRKIYGRDTIKIVTIEHEIIVEKFSENNIRGKSFDVYFNLTGDSVVEESLQKAFRI